MPKPIDKSLAELLLEYSNLLNEYGGNSQQEVAFYQEQACHARFEFEANALRILSLEQESFLNSSKRYGKRNIDE